MTLANKPAHYIVWLPISSTYRLTFLYKMQVDEYFLGSLYSSQPKVTSERAVDVPARRCTRTDVPMYPGYICPTTEVPTPYALRQGGYIRPRTEVPTPYAASQGGISVLGQKYLPHTQQVRGYIGPRKEVPTPYAASHGGMSVLGHMYPPHIHCGRGVHLS